MLNEIHVIHIKDAPRGWQTDPRYVYIGRAGKGLSGEYGNTHPIGYCAPCRTSHERDDAINAFAADARSRFENDPTYRAKVEQLRGKRLVCFCRPKRCHGDIYIELLHERRLAS